MILAFLAFIHGVPTVSVKPRTLWDTLGHPHNSLEHPKNPETPYEQPGTPQNA